MRQTSPKKPSGPHYEVGDCTGPNAARLRQELASPKPPQPTQPIDAEIAELDEALATITDKRNTAPDAENRAVADAEKWRQTHSAQETGGVYGLDWGDPGTIEGEPPAHAIVWNLGPDKPPTGVLEARAVADALGRKLTWARAEIENLRHQLKGIEQHSADAIEIKREVVAALKELVPLAKRNAKRGSPALLRLITRAIKTKL